ncbi:hypothetical protein NDU88_010866 [Pleurodeles waltl]|uniref:Uncharacterized protein n=1 Tax=Pleurodeles waltl TaxID=8319 RepID=A0AAV7S0I8_PLEWA|nr:hypothetical protein NDU88_010866 [Pleurodeles waltl]
MTVAGATTDNNTGKCPRGTFRLKDPASSEHFRGYNAGSRGQVLDSVREEKEQRARGDSRGRQQGQRNNPQEEDDTEEPGEAQRQEKENSQTREGRDTEEQEQERRGNARKEEDGERRGEGGGPRVRSEDGREELHNRKPCHVPGGMWLHKVQSYFLTRAPTGEKEEGEERVREQTGQLTP